MDLPWSMPSRRSSHQRHHPPGAYQPLGAATGLASDVWWKLLARPKSPFLKFIQYRLFRFHLSRVSWGTLAGLGQTNSALLLWCRSSKDRKTCSVSMNWDWNCLALHGQRLRGLTDSQGSKKRCSPISISKSPRKSYPLRHMNHMNAFVFVSSPGLARSTAACTAFQAASV